MVKIRKKPKAFYQSQATMWVSQCGKKKGRLWQAGQVSVQGGSSWAVGKKCAWADQQGNAVGAWGGEFIGESPEAWTSCKCGLVPMLGGQIKRKANKVIPH